MVGPSGVTAGGRTAVGFRPGERQRVGYSSDGGFKVSRFVALTAADRQTRAADCFWIFFNFFFADSVLNIVYVRMRIYTYVCMQKSKIKGT